MEDPGDEVTEMELDEWYRLAARDPGANLGAQVRDRKIRRLIEALRRGQKGTQAEE